MNRLRRPAAPRAVARAECPVCKQQIQTFERYRKGKRMTFVEFHDSGLHQCTGSGRRVE